MIVNIGMSTFLEVIEASRRDKKHVLTERVLFLFLIEVIVAMSYGA